MFKTVEGLRDFMKSTQEDSAAICRASMQLGDGEGILCFVQKGHVSFETNIEDGRRMNVIYRFNGEAVSKVEEETVITEVTV